MIAKALFVVVISVVVLGDHAHAAIVTKSAAPQRTRRNTTHGVDPNQISAEALISDGPAEGICVSRDGGPHIEDITWDPDEEETVLDYGWIPVPGSNPPREEWGVVGSHQVTLRRWKIVTLACGDGHTWTARVCVPAAAACPPRKPKPNGRDVAKHNVQHIRWPDVHPKFAPEFQRGGPYAFAITQAPFYYWFVPAEYRWLEARARACIDDDCVTAYTQARPIAAGFDPGTLSEGIPDLITCVGPGPAIKTPGEYETGRSTNECQYTYNHSSTTVGGYYHATAFIDYQIWIGEDLNNMEPDPGNIWTVERDLLVPVGEV